MLHDLANSTKTLPLKYFNFLIDLSAILRLEKHSQKSKWLINLIILFDKNKEFFLKN